MINSIESIIFVILHSNVYLEVIFFDVKLIFLLTNASFTYTSVN